MLERLQPESPAHSMAVRFIKLKNSTTGIEPGKGHEESGTARHITVIYREVLISMQTQCCCRAVQCNAAGNAADCTGFL